MESEALELDGEAVARRFDYFVTHDRELMLLTARPLLDRILPSV